MVVVVELDILLDIVQLMSNNMSDDNKKKPIRPFNYFS